MMLHQQHATITRSGKHWHVETRQHWQGWKHPAITGGGENTLDWALYSIAAWCRRSDTALLTLTIDGKPASKARVQQAIDGKAEIVLSLAWRQELTDWLNSAEVLPTA